MTFLASPWLLKSSVIIQFGGSEFCWSEEGWCRCQMSINLQSIIVTTRCQSRPGDDLVTRPWVVQPTQAPKFLKCYTCKNITLSSLPASARFLSASLPSSRSPHIYVLALFPPLGRGVLHTLLSSLLVPSPPRTSDAGNTATCSLEKGHTFFLVLLFRSVWLLLETKHWFCSALLAFRQRGLYWKSLCQELETVSNNGENSLT